MTVTRWLGEANRRGEHERRDPLRRTKADGRWFVATRPYSEQALERGYCDLADWSY